MSILFDKLNTELKTDINKISKFFRNLSLIQIGLLLIACSIATAYAYKEAGQKKKQQSSIDVIASDISLLMRNLEEINEPVIMLKIVRENCSYMSAELQAQTANSIYQTAKLRGIKMSIACALAEQETEWDFRKTNEESGATGGFQVLPYCAKPYLNLLYGGYTKEKLLFPPTNAMVGLSLFGDRLSTALDRGLNEHDALVKALGQYRWGEKIENDGYANSVLNKSKKYEERFKTPLKELKSTK